MAKTAIAMNAARSTTTAAMSRFTLRVRIGPVYVDVLPKSIFPETFRHISEREALTSADGRGISSAPLSGVEPRPCAVARGFARGAVVGGCYAVVSCARVWEHVRPDRDALRHGEALNGPGGILMNELHNASGSVSTRASLWVLCTICIL